MGSKGLVCLTERLSSSGTGGRSGGWQEEDRLAGGGGCRWTSCGMGESIGQCSGSSCWDEPRGLVGVWVASLQWDRTWAAARWPQLLGRDMMRPRNRRQCACSVNHPTLPDPATTSIHPPE